MGAKSELTIEQKKLVTGLLVRERQALRESHKVSYKPHEKAAIEFYFNHLSTIVSKIDKAGNYVKEITR